MMHESMTEKFNVKDLKFTIVEFLKMANTR